MTANDDTSNKTIIAHCCYPLSLFIGLFLVILFINLYVIPHESNPEFVDTYYTVEGIYKEVTFVIVDRVFHEEWIVSS